MKKFKNLYQKITYLDNIKLAHHNARKNKTHRNDVKKVDADIEGFCKQIQDMLINHTYKTSEYFTFKLYEPKERIIFKLPYFPDRIVHHAIMNIMEPLWINQMISQTYSCIKKRGIHKVLKQIQHDLKDRENTKYCLKIDIRKFYPSVDHDILKQIIRIKVSDRELLQLLDEIIDSSDGVPIDNYLSQFFANLYLSYFDHWVKEDKNIKYYYRYADDIVILYKDKESLQTLLRDIKQYLKDNLKLQLKNNYQVFPVESRSIDFVGYKIYHNFTLVRKALKKRYCKKNAKLNKRSTNYKYYRRKMASYIGWFKHANCYSLLTKTIKHKELLNYLDIRKGNRTYA